METLVSELAELIHMVKELAPDVWAMALLQARINAWTQIGVGVFSLVVFGGLLAGFVHGWRLDRDGADGSYWMIPCGLFGAAVLILGLALVASGATELANLPWHAIKLLLSVR